MRRAACLVLSATIGTSCGGAPEGLLNGSVEKGPFIEGSSVRIAVIDTSGSPTGVEYATETLDDRGSFSLTSAPAGAVSVEATGFYFDEISGALSDAPITFSANTFSET